MQTTTVSVSPPETNARGRWALVFFPFDFVSAFFHVSENKSTVLCAFLSDVPCIAGPILRLDRRKRGHASMFWIGNRCFTNSRS